MDTNIFIIFLAYLFVIFSVIGYGSLFSKYIFKKKSNLNFGYLGTVGIVILSIYSYFSHIFIAHNIGHNLILILLGILFFLIFCRKRSKEILFSLSIFSIIFISLIIFKTHDDFPYYHFGYSYYITQTSLHIGVGQFNHGFNTPSLIFYLNSLFYLPLIKFYFFHLPAVLFLGFTNIIFIKYLTDAFKNKEINFTHYFTLFGILFINIFFYRIAEHGTDRSAQILIFLLLLEVLIFIYLESLNKIQLSKIFLLLGLIISLKAFYVLYIIILIPVFFKLKEHYSFKNIFIILINNYSFYLFTGLFLLVLLTNFVNSGCLIYPVGLTCFTNLDWSISYELVKHMNNWYEQWSKAGAGPNFRVTNASEYIKGFNWTSNWMDKYFFNKVSDFLFGIFFLTIIVGALSYSKEKKFFFINKYAYLLYFLLILLLFEWFYNHPSLRYGGFILFCSILFIPASFLYSGFKVNFYKLKKIFSLLIIFSLLVFVGRNLFRINSEITKYDFNPLKDFSYRVKKSHYSIQESMDSPIKNFIACKNKTVDCKGNIEPKVSKLLNKFKFTREN